MQNMREEQKVNEICRLLDRNRLVFGVNRKLSNGDSIIHAMIRYRSKDLQLPNYLARLLAQGADPNATNTSGETPLIFASKNKLLVAAQVLANNDNTELEVEDKGGKTAIMHAVTENAPDIVNELVRASRIRRHTQHLLGSNRIGQSQRELAKSMDTIELAETELRRNNIDKPSPPVAVKRNSLIRQTENQQTMSASVPRGWVGYRRELRKIPSKQKIESNVTDAVRSAQSVNLARKRFIGLIGVYKGRGRSIDKPENGIERERASSTK